MKRLLFILMVCAGSAFSQGTGFPAVQDTCCLPASGNFSHRLIRVAPKIYIYEADAWQVYSEYSFYRAIGDSITGTMVSADSTHWKTWINDSLAAVRADFPLGGETDTTSLSNRIDLKKTASDSARGNPTAYRTQAQAKQDSVTIATKATGSGTASGTNTGDQTLPTDATLSFSDITTNDASTSAHGFLKKLDGLTTTFLRGDGAWASPTASAAWGSITGTLSSQTDLQNALDLKAPLANPTFTGTVTVPTPFTIGAVSMTATGTELNFVDGVTSGIQGQLDGKQTSDADLTTIAGLTATTDNFIVAAASAWASRTPAQAKTSLALVKADVGLGSVDNLQQQPIDADLTALAGLSGVEGDIIYRDATQWQRLPKGTASQVLTINAGATAPEWQTPGAGSGPVSVLTLASDATENETTSMVEITGLNKTVGAGTYAFEYYIRAQTVGAAANSIKFAVNHTGTTTVFIYSLQWPSAGVTASTGAVDQEAAAITTGSVWAHQSTRVKNTTLGPQTGLDTDAADVLFRITGLMIVTVSGDLELYHGSELTQASGTIVKAGSSLVLTKTN